MKTAAQAQLEPRKRRSDERLVALCLKGDQEAWADLVEQYKNLIYSVPIKFGMYDDAADIFQSVCLDLLSDLPKLLEPKALPKWLMQVSYHKCLEHRARAKKQVPLEEEDAEKIPDGAGSPEGDARARQREQIVRDVVARIAGPLRADGPGCCSMTKSSPGLISRSRRNWNCYGIDRVHSRTLPHATEEAARRKWDSSERQGRPAN